MQHGYSHHHQDLHSMTKMLHDATMNPRLPPSSNNPPKPQGPHNHYYISTIIGNSQCTMKWGMQMNCHRQNSKLLRNPLQIMSP